MRGASDLRATEGGEAAREADPGANPCSACSAITLRLVDTPLALARPPLVPASLSAMATSLSGLFQT
jgi:hypothetical protein